MDRRFLTVLGVSLVFALVVSSVFYQMTSRGSSSSEPAANTEEVEVVVAARPLGVGVMIKTQDIRLAKMPAAAVPKGAFTKAEEVLDRPVVSNILLDEPVLDGRLAAKGSGLGLAPTIPVGMRAVTVRVNDVAGVAGFVLPGMHVDVLVTGSAPGEEGTMTNTVLQNMLVLSAGKELQPDAQGNAMPTPTVTLMAKPSEAEILTLANNFGQIQLVLRNSSDQETADTQGSIVSELFGGEKRAKPAAEPAPAPRPRPVRSQPVQTASAAAPVAAPPPPPPPPAAPPEIVVIRGTQRTVEVVGKSAN
ncbi:MAG: Flp pilus assembly protein CpaB [Acidobacteriota bacterium]|jgi:pilus assembly protein CpaB